jgi:hypothetical protein
MNLPAPPLLDLQQNWREVSVAKSVLAQPTT